jgi:hypothetical protein
MGRLCKREPHLGPTLFHAGGNLKRKAIFISQTRIGLSTGSSLSSSHPRVLTPQISFGPRMHLHRSNVFCPEAILPSKHHMHNAGLNYVMVEIARNASYPAANPTRTWLRRPRSRKSV